MDVLRARAYLDLLLGTDSRPRQDAAGGQDGGRGDGGPEEQAAGSAPRGGPGRWPGDPAGPRLAAGGERDAGRVRRPGHPDRPAGHPARPGRAARRARPASARSTPPWPATSPAPPPAIPETTWCVTVTDEQGHAIGHGCARPEPKNHAGRREKPDTARRADPIRPAAPAAPPGRDSPSPPPASTARPADTAPGRCAPGPAASEIYSSRSTRSPLRTATTGSRPRATIPGSSSGTCPRSGTPPAPARSAGDPPPPVISSTTSPMRQAAGPVCAMPGLSAATTTGSNSTPAGTSTSSPTAPSGGPLRPAASTPPNPPGTRSNLRRHQQDAQDTKLRTPELRTVSSRQQLKVADQLGHLVARPDQADGEQRQVVGVGLGEFA